MVYVWCAVVVWFVVHGVWCIVYSALMFGVWCMVYSVQLLHCVWHEVGVFLFVLAMYGSDLMFVVYCVVVCFMVY